jgi:hypothetical protein
VKISWGSSLFASDGIDRDFASFPKCHSIAGAEKENVPPGGRFYGFTNFFVVTGGSMTAIHSLSILAARAFASDQPAS